MSKQEPISNPPPYTGNTYGVDGAYPPQNAPYPPGYNTSGPPPAPYPPQQYSWPVSGYANPGQPGYAPQYGAQQMGYSNATTVVVSQPAVTIIQVYREVPVRTTCPHCRADVVTATQYETGTLTWIACFVLCLFGCVLGCCLFPFCIDGCKDVIHTCPNCRQQIGRFNRM